MDVVFEKPIVQKVFKCNRSKSGNTVFSRKQIGVMVAGISPFEPDKVLIGYSLCHRNDKYNCPGGVKKPNFDKVLALQRAIKWNMDDVQAPEIPYSLRKPFGKFVHRCRTYYKDRSLTDWIHYVDFDRYEPPARVQAEDENAEGC
jgi:hypothetical protein